MEAKAYFHNIHNVIIDNIKSAQKEILVAVAWFTDHRIYEALLEKLLTVKVSLIIVNDDINNKDGGLNFQEFIDKGGSFYFGEADTPMHNKYCIIDQSILLTGSYNYTYRAASHNEENLVRIVGDSELVNEFRANFLQIVSHLRKVGNIHDYHIYHPVIQNLHSIEAATGWDDYMQSVNEHEQVKTEYVRINKQTTSAALTQIQIKGDTIIFSIRTKPSQFGVIIYGPGMEGMWIMSDCNDPSIEERASEITDIKINGQIINHPKKNFVIDVRYHSNNDFQKLGIINQDGRYVDKKNPERSIEYIFHNVYSSPVIEFNLCYYHSKLTNKKVKITEKNYERVDCTFWDFDNIDLSQR